MPPRIAILTSGGGGGAEALIAATQDGRLDAEVTVIVCSKPPGAAGVYERIARCNGRFGLDLQVVEVSRQTHPQGDRGRGQTDAESAAITQLLEAGGVDHVALLGYMRIVRGRLLEEFGWSPGSPIHAGRMSNSHPGPLPETADTYGLATAARVLELGAGETRHTLHLVSAGVDTGPILAEHPLEVYADDTAESLFRRVVAVERVAVPYALGAFLSEVSARTSAAGPKS